MGLRTRVSWILLIVASVAASLSAAPRLRLSTAAVGPILVSTGGTVAAQTVEATNAGDGSLSLHLTSSATWMTAGTSGACTTQGCTPITVNVSTSGLQKGTYTGVVTVADSNAIDAPQTITVTLLVGGGVPDKLDFYAPPGGTDDIAFTAGNELSFSPQANPAFLSIIEDGAGSFRFQRPYRPFAYRAHAAAQSGMGEGSYTGQLVVSGGSLVPADNKTVPATFRVTSQPIAQLGASAVQLRGAQGSLARVGYLSVANRGLGSLTLSSVSAATTSGSGWLSASIVSGLVAVTADPGALAVGVYQGSVTINSNAVQGALTVPVSFEVIAAGPPQLSYQGAANVADGAWGSTVGQGGFVEAFGEQFDTGAPVQAMTTPYPTTLGNVQVFVNDEAAPVQYVQYDQVNFQMPYDVAPGPAVLRIDRQGQRGNSITVNIAASAPRIFQYAIPGLTDYGILTHIDGALVLPSSTGLGRPAKKGEVVTIWAVGLGQTVPSVRAGDSPPSSPLAQIVPMPAVSFGGSLFNMARATPLFAGLAPGYPGLYLINVQIPDAAPTSDAVFITIGVGSVQSNSPLIAVTAP